jgi:hypothetical protein
MICPVSKPLPNITEKIRAKKTMPAKHSVFAVVLEVR